MSQIAQLMYIDSETMALMITKYTLLFTTLNDASFFTLNGGVFA